MKLIINKYLNIRSGSPSTEAPCPGYKVPGDILEVDDIVPGTAIDGNSVWYHSPADGCYYWSGGVEPTDEVLSARPGGKEFSFREQMDIYRSAANELVQDFQHIPGFKGLAAGYKRSGGQVLDELALIFYVFNKEATPSAPIPVIIHYRGFALTTDVHPVGTISLLADPIPPDVDVPFMMGGSISEIVNGTQSSVGTRTLLVTKEDTTYLLTCFHVACASLMKAGGRELGNNKVSVGLPSEFISPENSSLTFPVAEGAFTPNLDYALIKVDPAAVSNRMPGTEFKPHYSTKELEQVFEEKRLLRKYGITTLETTGRIITYHSASIPINQQKTLFLSGLIETEDMSDSGDSGAPVVDDQNQRLVGYIVAGGHQVAPFCTYIIPFAALADKSINPKP